MEESRRLAGRVCSEEGCGKPGTRSTQRKILCSAHYKAAWYDRQPRCSEPDCESRATQGRGLCGKHYARTVRVADDRPRCSVEGCGRAAVSRTYCTVHYQRWQRTGEPGEGTLRRVNYKPGDLCGVPGCQKPLRANGYCGSHNRRLSKFGITHTELERLLQGQHGRCAICRAAQPGGSGDWCIDHDHVTGQVRALLCTRCNCAIGLLQDDPEIIRAAAQYVEKHRQMELFHRKAASA